VALDKGADRCDKQHCFSAVGRRDKTKHPQTTQGQRSLPQTAGAAHRSRTRTNSKTVKEEKAR